MKAVLTAQGGHSAVQGQRQYQAHSALEAARLPGRCSPNKRGGFLTCTKVSCGLLAMSVVPRTGPCVQAGAWL